MVIIWAVLEKLPSESPFRKVRKMDKNLEQAKILNQQSKNPTSSATTSAMGMDSSLEQAKQQMLSPPERK
jgi:hypothetical protein